MTKNTVFGIILFVVMFWFGLSSCIKNPIREVCICKGDVCAVESYNINFNKSKKNILKKDIRPKTLNKSRKYSGVDIKYIEPVFSTPYYFVPFADSALDNIYDNYESKIVKYNFMGFFNLFCSLLIFSLILRGYSNKNDKNI